MRHIIDTEKTVIGHLLLNGNKPEVINLISEIKPDYFFSDLTLRAFKVIRDLISEGGEVSILTVREKSKLPATFLTECSSLFCSDLKYQITQLKRYADKRWLIQKLNRGVESIEDKKPDILMAEISTDLTNRIRETDDDKTDIKDLISEFEEYQETNKLSVEKGGLIGFSFGFPILDQVISGIRPGHYIVVKAGTSTGKSNFALNVVSQALNQNKRVLLFSLEMSQEQNIARILGIRTNIKPTEIESGVFKDQDFELNAKEKLYNQKLNIIEQKRGIDEILTTIRAENVLKKIDLVVIDYIQNIALDGDRYESYTNASNKIQTIASLLKTPIIVCSQINKMGDTRGTGDIDNHADFAIKLEKTEEVGVIEMLVTKNRHGMLTGGRLKFEDGGNLIEIK